MQEQKVTEKYVSGAYFEVSFGVIGGIVGALSGLSGRFTSVSGLGMEVSYQTYYEGGSMAPTFLLDKGVPQKLVLEQGTVTDTDTFAMWMKLVNSGMSISMDGEITLKDAAGRKVRSWSINSAVLVSYSGPVLNSNSPSLAVSRIEFMYGGCT